VRTVYLGTSPFAVSVLEALAAGPHRPVLVITRPDRPAGRGRRVAAPPVADAARLLGMEVFQPESVNGPEAVRRIAASAPEAVCVCAFGALITEPLLSEHLMLNVHPSLLPRWRGAAPVERAIMAGDQRTGASIMRMAAGLDSGPVCLRRDEPIGSEDTYGTLSERLAALGGELLVDALDELPACQEQEETGATYAEKITAQDRRLDPSRPAEDLERIVRALTPHIGARLEHPGMGPLGVRRAIAVEDAVGEGELLARDGRLVLGCADGALELLEVQPAGGRAMSAADYIRGRAP